MPLKYTKNTLAVKQPLKHPYKRMADLRQVSIEIKTKHWSFHGILNKDYLALNSNLQVPPTAAAFFHATQRIQNRGICNRVGSLITFISSVLHKQVTE